MTKTEYREYIAGEAWRRRRRDFLAQVNYCERCDAPRKLVVLVYDQDLHLHHRSYARVGNERPEDLEALCRRCHEIETFGRSELRKIEPYSHCQHCKEPVWDFACDHGIEELCARCTLMLDGLSPRAITSPRLERDADNLSPGPAFWKFVLWEIVRMIHPTAVQKALTATIESLEREESYSSWLDAVRDIPSSQGFVRKLLDKYKENPENVLSDENCGGFDSH